MIYGRTVPVVCGLVDLSRANHRCDCALIETPGPARSLVCPVHGVVDDLPLRKALTGVAFLNFGGGRGRAVRIQDISVT